MFVLGVGRLVSDLDVVPHGRNGEVPLIVVLLLERKERGLVRLLEHEAEDFVLGVVEGGRLVDEEVIVDGPMDELFVLHWIQSFFNGHFSYFKCSDSKNDKQTDK